MAFAAMKDFGPLAMKHVSKPAEKTGPISIPSHVFQIIQSFCQSPFREWLQLSHGSVGNEAAVVGKHFG